LLGYGKFSSLKSRFQTASTVIQYCKTVPFFAHAKNCSFRC
jgi:hypothetical protein